MEHLNTATVKNCERFETLWARYITALERLDAARANRDGHARRIRIGARKEATRLQGLLETRYGMHLGEG
jgi:hypothetical protein